jgi:hypothetical protein
MTKPNYYGILPAEVRYNETLTPNAKLLYSELTALCNKEGYCWASNKYFAQLYKTSKTSISNWFSSLQKEGFVKVIVAKNEQGTSRHIYLEGIKKSVGGHKEICNHNSTRTNNKKVSKDTKESTDSLRHKSSFTKKCIEDWNNISFTQNILVTRRTKQISRIEKYVGELLKGTFMNGKGNKVFDVEWFNDNKIPMHTIPYTKKEILVAVKNTALYSKDGYFTERENKSFMPKDLATLMYNPRTGKSWFLLAYYKKPKPFKIPLIDPDPKTTKYLIEQMKHSSDTHYEVKLHHGINSIRKFVMNIPKKSAGKFKIRNEVGTTLRITKAYVEWIKHQDWVDEINVSILNANNKLWKRFIKDKEGEYDGYKLS